MSSAASEYVKAHSGGGRAFLSAKMIQAIKGLSGTIAEVPYLENVQFSGEEPKDVFRVPLDLDQAVEVKGKRETSDRTDVLWSPGSNAVGLLIDELGQDESGWVGTHGTFEQRVMGNFAPWCFIPDGKKTAPTAKKSLISKIQTPPVKASPSKSQSFKCGMCSAHFDSAQKLKDHINRAH